MTNYDGYLDRYGMVTVNEVPNHPAGNSENGLLFTVVAIQSQILNSEPVSFDFTDLFEPCFIDGKLYRSPEPHPKAESHDNYTACALGSLIENNPSIPRRLLLSIIKNFGVINGEVIGRFPQVWILLLATSFPFLRYLLLPVLYALYLLQKPSDTNDTSGIQLQFVIVSIIDKLYPRFNLLKKWFTKLNQRVKMYEVMKVYYGENHPNCLIWKDSEIC